MAQINVSINGRSFRMACEDGQEPHLTSLAALLDARIAELRKSFGELGDTRLTVMAAITIADDLSEAERRIRRLEEELTALQDARVMSADRAQHTQAAIAAALNSAAERIEGVTRKLNQTVGPGDTLPMG